MKYLSVCSGIEAASVAWHPLGWEPVAFSEIEAFPSAVLAHRFPSVPNLGDMTKFKEWKIGRIDALVGGTPCQSFSVAGLRRGLADPRGNLMLVYGAIADHFRPSWIVWENVPGVLSSNGGRDFGTFLGMLGELGYGFAYRVLDAQFFGVPQRRRRVFVVGYFGDWRPAAAVLFESESLRGDTPPSREKRERPSGATAFGIGESGDVAHCLRSGASKADKHESTTYVCFERNTPDGHARLVGEIAPTLNRMGGGQREPCIFTPVAMTTGQGNAEITEGHAPTLNCNHEAPILAFDGYNQTLSDTVQTIRADKSDGDHVGMVFQSTVRRLTPRECERLQGFPDDWTRIPWRGKPAPDGPRYKACGNSMAVPVMRWIGERIVKAEALKWS